ncbi:hypothetical protein FACS189413_17830 [Bacteroidia bacterium]|nr:hypothetical protein FACS189413_17830 [Bacteroidia bacterium]
MKHILKNKFTYLLLAVIILGAACTFGSFRKSSVKNDFEANTLQRPMGIVAKVNPFIGTSGFVKAKPEAILKNEDLEDLQATAPFSGGCYPGVQRPFGMVQLSPDLNVNRYSSLGGYQYSDSTVMGFVHQHTSGNGLFPDWILVMPTVGELLLDPSTDTEPDKGYRSQFSHEEEKAWPGYYAVRLSDYDIVAELTTTERTGFHRYTFPETDHAHIILDLTHCNSAQPDHLKIQKINNKTVTGFVGIDKAPYQSRMYFAIEFSKAFDDFGFVNGDTKTTGASEGDQVKAYFNYQTKAGEKILLKVGLSPISEENALKTIEIENPNWNFEKTIASNYLAWTEQLEKINISGGTDDQQTVFYTALYHTMLAPFLNDDPDHTYIGRDGLPHQDGFTNYTFFSLWDTYRSQHPILTLLHPERVNDLVNSMLHIALYDPEEILPGYAILNTNAHGMCGQHVMPVLLEAIVKGFDGFDIEKTYELMRKNSIRTGDGLDLLHQYGYIPSDKLERSAAETIEFAYDEWCIEQLAHRLGKQKDEQYFNTYALSYRNLYDAKTGFFRPKLANGQWMEPFDPIAVSHQEVGSGFCEANAWQYLFHIQHKPYDLIQLMGGKENFEKRLDELFSQSSRLTGDYAADVTGMIGQYAQGNEQSQHVAYMYNYAGAPWKTQNMVRRILDEKYPNTPGGICGNDDGGQTSSWYVFSALGFYPVNPAQAVYVIGAPLFDEATIRVGENAFTVKAENNTAENKYIQSATLNGKPYSRSWITHQTIIRGGELKFVMGNTPNKAWGGSPADCPPEGLIE